MSATPPRSGVEALQSAVIAILKADDGVKLLVNGRIYDEVPGDKDKPKAPYVYLGPCNRRRIEGGECIDTKGVTFRLFVVSTEYGRTEAWAVVDALELALNGKSLKLAGPWSTCGDVVRSIQDGDVVQPLDPKSAFADFSTTITRTGA